MTGLNDVMSRQHGVYRAYFNSKDLGELALPPEIRSDCEVVKVPVYDDDSAAGYDEIGSVPRLFGSVVLRLFAAETVWKLIAGNDGNAGELALHPAANSKCGILVFPVAHLLPRWEFSPTTAGAHTLSVYFQLKSDPAGKIFYYMS